MEDVYCLLVTLLRGLKVNCHKLLQSMNVEVSELTPSGWLAYLDLRLAQLSRSFFDYFNPTDMSGAETTYCLLCV